MARSSRGYDAGKKINGRKGHIAVDTNGLLLAVGRGNHGRDSSAAMARSGCWPRCVPDSRRSAWCGRTVAMPDG
ncbi:transposase [Rhodococcus jostii]|uniref:transposase n=1 Tax=Rhodococcus jostii TaxID=132919 RepID=UPI003628CC18